MLRLLHVENFAVIEHVELRFGPAFNVITGETGAGKSLLVEALLSVLGERVSSDAIRSGARKAVIEAYFSIEGNRGITTLLDESGYPCIEENTLIVRREIAASGSRAFINDSPASLHLLKQLGELLVDFHGQHEHQSLLRTSLHRVLLDSVGGLDRLVSEFNAEYHRLVLLVEQYRQLLEREQQIRSQLGWYRHQLDELTAIAPQAGELQQLESELRRIEHSEQLYEGSSTAYSLLYGNDHSAHDVLVRARNIAEQLSCYDDYLRTVAAELRELVIRTDELAKDIQRYNAQLEFSPERSQYIRERLVQLGRLVKRYGSIERAIEEQQRIEREIALAENFDAEIEQLRVAIAAQRDLLGTIGERLSAKRQQVARRAERSIGEILRRLGMSDAEFSVVIEKALVPSPEQTELVAHVGDEFIAAYEHGLDQVSFHIRTNAGQPLAPLQRIISGGEASRVMLALKTILAKSDRLPILIFDEIDTGVSGRIAHRVGLALEELGAYHQVIAITHNPQIAARAQVHIVVEKHTSGQQTHVVAHPVSGPERIEAIARLLAGEQITDGAINTARELLESNSTTSISS